MWRGAARQGETGTAAPCLIRGLRLTPTPPPLSRLSSCAYNTGIGWRNIIEKMHMTATLTKWYEEHGRHEIFAGGKTVPLASTAHSLKLNEEAVRAGAQTDLDDLGIAKNAREEKLKARQQKDGSPSGSVRPQPEQPGDRSVRLQPERPGDRSVRPQPEQPGDRSVRLQPDGKDVKYHEEMAKLYRQHVLKEQPTLQIVRLGGKKKQETVTVN